MGANNTYEFISQNSACVLLSTRQTRHYAKHNHECQAYRLRAITRRGGPSMLRATHTGDGKCWNAALLVSVLLLTPGHRDTWLPSSRADNSHDWHQSLTPQIDT